MNDSSTELRSKRAAYMRGWYARHRDKVIKRVARWQKNNPIKMYGYRKANRALYKEERKVKYQKWSADNRVRLRAKAAARRTLAPHRLTKVYEKLNLKSLCHWCSGILSDGNIHIDHVTPLSRGGKHSEDNLVASCARCNRSKGDKMYWEWDGELAS